MKDVNSYERYQRQLLLKEFGIAAQKKLQAAKVLVAGAGGLGCPALQYLAAAGVGIIGIADDDVVMLHNLHRQVLYTMHDIGLSKAEVAAKKLQALNNEIQINVHDIRIDNRNALNILKDYDLIVDGTDNFATRYMLNDACVLLNKPLVYAAISKFEGQVAVFNAKGKTNLRGVNYRDLFPQPPKENEVLNCAEAGVLGVLPGIIGTMQANETIKLITGIGENLIDKLITYNALNNSTYIFSLSLNEEAQTLIPGDATAFINTNYDWLCSCSLENIFEIDTVVFNNLINDDDTIIIDVREKDEPPTVVEFEHIQIPLGELIRQHSLIEKDNVVLFCQSGKRSLLGVDILSSVFKDKKIYSLKGGIIEWNKSR